jgi:cation diffusion facilitator family transporter
VRRTEKRMGLLERFNRQTARWFIRDFDQTDDKLVRIQYGLAAGWVGISVSVALFVVKMALGLMSGSASIVASAFHLLSHLANSVILVISFQVAARPATAKTPFGHGRMEHVAPLIMSIFLFVSGIQIGETAIHQALNPHELNYWSALPWVLLLTIVVKQWLAGFVRFLGERIESHAIMANAAHQNVEAAMTLAVIGGLVAGQQFHHPEVDGFIGIVVSAWLLYLGYTHAREAIVPLLGQAPSKELIRKIRETTKSVEGVEDAHEIIVHDYGSMYLISLHAEITAGLGPDEMHEIAERSEDKLREAFGGTAVVHTDPMMERTPEIQAIEDSFREVVEAFPQIASYHDFRVVAASRERIVIVADISTSEDVAEDQFDQLSEDLEARVIERIPNVAYCSFYVTPKFAY